MTVHPYSETGTKSTYITQKTFCAQTENEPTNIKQENRCNHKAAVENMNLKLQDKLGSLEESGR